MIGDSIIYGVTRNTRSAKFIVKYGDISVELDALPVGVLHRRIVGETEAPLELDPLANARAVQDNERVRLGTAAGGVS